jgi:hypothetical protein
VSGVRIEVKGFHNRPMTPPPRGEHQWVALAMFRVNPTADRYELDAENLLTIEGPGCFLCEQPWSAAIAAAPCTGNR